MKKRIVIQNIADTHFGFGAKRQLLIALNKEPKTSREEVTKCLIYTVTQKIVVGLKTIFIHLNSIKENYFSLVDITQFQNIKSIKFYIKPRMIKWDRGFVMCEAVELQEYTKIKIRFNENNECFSWSWIILEIVKDVKNAKNTKWWTYKRWKKDFDNKKAFCPKCGKTCFDID